MERDKIDEIIDFLNKQNSEYGEYLTRFKENYQELNMLYEKLAADQNILQVSSMIKSEQ